MAASSLTLSQAIGARTISHHGSNPSFDRLSLSFTLTLPPFSGLKSSSSISSSHSSQLSGSKQRRLSSRRATTIRASAVETLDKTTKTNLVEKSVNTIRFLAIDAVEKVNSGHPGLSMGCAPMGHILYDEIMRIKFYYVDVNEVTQTLVKRGNISALLEQLRGIQEFSDDGI